MEPLIVHAAANGVAILLVSLCAGLYTYRAALRDEPPAAWHLAHAGGTARGVMLMSVAAIARVPVLPSWELSLAVWLLIFFSWTSVAAMIVAAATRQRGLRLRGTVANKSVFLLYVAGGIAVFPAGGILLAGLLRALAGGAQG